MAQVTDKHRRLAREAIRFGELHGPTLLLDTVAKAIADAEERGRQEATKTDEPKPTGG